MSAGKGASKCAAISSILGLSSLSFAGQLALTQPVFAQSPATTPGFSFADLWTALASFFGPTGPILGPLIAIWTYSVANPAVMTFIVAVVAAIIAVQNILSSRQMARVTATFNMAYGSVWDADYIKARNDFKAIKNELAAEGVSIAKFANPTTKQDIEHAVTCTTILNDYENMSLGIQNHILDERYLYDWTHSLVKADWLTLKPLVDAYIGPRRTGDTTYYQFEKLADAWTDGRSLRTGRKMRVSRGRAR